MTSNNESPQDSGSLENGEPSSPAPAKAPRRRVTRVAAAPSIKPVSFITAEPVTSAPPATSPATQPTLDLGGAGETAPAEQAPTQPVRKSRRATSAAGAPRVQKDAQAAPAPEATVASDTAKKLAQIELPAAVDKQVQAEKPARKTNARAAKGPKAELDVLAEVAALAAKKSQAPAATDSAPAASVEVVNQVVNLDAVAQDHEAQIAKSSRARAAKRQGTKQANAQQSQNEAPQVEERAEAPSPSGNGSEARKDTDQRRRRVRTNQVFMDPRNSTPTPAPAAQAPQKPRLATTALLFQAPDLSQAEVIKARADQERETALAAEEELAEATAKSSSEQRQGRSSNDSSRNSRKRSADRTPQPAPADEVTEEDEESTEALVETASKRGSNAAQPAAADEVENDQDESDDHDEQDSADGTDESTPRRRRRRGGRGRRNRNSNDQDSSEDNDEDSSSPEAQTGDQDSSNADQSPPDSEEVEDSDRDSRDSNDQDSDDSDEDSEEYSSSRRRRRRRRGTRTGEEDSSSGRSRSRNINDEVTALKGSTRLEAKRQRRREGRDAGRRRSIITEAEFLARRESVERSMVVREHDGRTQIAVLEDGVLVEHYVSQQQQASMAGNVYLGRVQNVLPSMEAAFIDVGKGRNAVLYAGEVNWDAAGLDGQPRRIEAALKSGDQVLVQVTKDPIGHKGARLTSQVTLAGRYLVFVPGGGMTGISRKLPDTERARLKRILKEIVPEGTGVIVRTAAEGASEEELTSDIARLQTQWENIQKKAKTASAPSLLQGEPDLAIRVVRDIFNDDFTSLQVQGTNAWTEISQYVQQLAPDLADRVTHWVSEEDIFAKARVDEQLAKGMDRKVWLPSGGSLVIDRTEAMTVIDVNTGKFTGAGGTLEETVTRNNLESAEEIVRQLRLRDIGGIIVIDFIDMVLESNRDLVLRRLVECLGRDRTKHQVAEVTSLGLVQMTRKRVGQGLVEAFSTTCEHCNGRGFIVHQEPNERQGAQGAQNAAPQEQSEPKRSKRKRNQKDAPETQTDSNAVARLDTDVEAREAVKATLATIAAAASSSHEESQAPAKGAGSKAAEPTKAVEVEEQAPPVKETAPKATATKPARKSSRAQGKATKPAQVIIVEAAVQPVPVEEAAVEAKAEKPKAAKATASKAKSATSAKEKPAKDKTAKDKPAKSKTEKAGSEKAKAPRAKTTKTASAKAPRATTAKQAAKAADGADEAAVQVPSATEQSDQT